MSYYSRNYGNSEGSWFTIIICFILIFAIVIGVNACSAETWNDGICAECETRYELRGVSKGLKYYSCPDCGQEVTRY